MAPTDRIELRGLVISGICGALPEERERAQPLEVDLDVVADLSAAGESDDLADTLDYGSITEQVEGIITSGAPMLLERLARTIADAVLADPRAVSVTVAVRKLRPPVPQVMDTSGVRITRSRSSLS
jgi:dihydroneopterin aldolase